MNQETYGRLLGEAVAALTAAARLTVAEDRPDGQTVEVPGDWAEFVTLALAGAAANIGGVEEILTGRPGSWEAEFVRQTLHATVGPDEAHLWERRTEPVAVTVYAREMSADAGLEDAYEDAATELDSRFAAAAEDSPEASAVNALWDRMDEQWRADLATYGAAVADAVRARAAAIGLAVPVTVTVDTETNRAGERPRSTWVDNVLLDPAYADTPLPGSDVLARLTAEMHP